MEEKEIVDQLIKKEDDIFIILYELKPFSFEIGKNLLLVAVENDLKQRNILLEIGFFIAFNLENRERRELINFIENWKLSNQNKEILLFYLKNPILEAFSKNYELYLKYAKIFFPYQQNENLLFWLIRDIRNTFRGSYKRGVIPEYLNPFRPGSVFDADRPFDPPVNVLIGIANESEEKAQGIAYCCSLLVFDPNPLVRLCSIQFFSQLLDVDDHNSLEVAFLSAPKVLYDIPIENQFYGSTYISSLWNNMYFELVHAICKRISVLRNIQNIENKIYRELLVGEKEIISAIPVDFMVKNKDWFMINFSKIVESHTSNKVLIKLLEFYYIFMDTWDIEPILNIMALKVSKSLIYQTLKKFIDINMIGSIDGIEGKQEKLYKLKELEDKIKKMLNDIYK